MAGFSRREFLKKTMASGLAGGLVLSGLDKVVASSGPTVGTLIDLSKCDGCGDQAAPRCVTACREHNAAKFPDPTGEIFDYWPQKKHEDWSDKIGLTDRLTPYNWTFLQKVEVEHQGESRTVFVPRRCMHCDNPPCAGICPFSAIERTAQGAVVTDTDACFGGAKCRDVCPWHIPQRQAGVGRYMKIAPKFMGGGVMYKCDLCYDLVKKGQEPACVSACPKGAISFGDKEAMRTAAHQRAEEIGGFIYGEKENGGTSTFYVSPVPFEKIHAKLKVQAEAQGPEPKPGFPGMPPVAENFLDTVNGMAAGFVVAPVAGTFAAIWAAKKAMKGESEE